MLCKCNKDVFVYSIQKFSFTNSKTSAADGGMNVLGGKEDFHFRDVHVRHFASFSKVGCLNYTLFYAAWHNTKLRCKIIQKSLLWVIMELNLNK